jgi:hypothetical protein
MDAKRYLQQIEMYCCKIKNKQEEKAMWQELATGTSIAMGGERVQSSGAKDKMARCVAESVTIDVEIDMMKEKIREIIKTVEALSVEAYDILHKIYVQELSHKELLVCYQKSSSWVKDAHKKALEELQTVLDMRE